MSLVHTCTPDELVPVRAWVGYFAAFPTRPILCVSEEEPCGQVDDAADEREFLGHLLEATRTMLP